MQRVRVPLSSIDPDGPHFVLLHENDRTVYHGASKFAGTVAQLDSYLAEANAKAREPQALTYNPSLAVDAWPASMLEFCRDRALDLNHREPDLVRPSSWSKINDTLSASLLAARNVLDANIKSEQLATVQLAEGYEKLKIAGLLGKQATAEFANCQTKLTQAMRKCESDCRMASTNARTAKLQLVRSTLEYMHTLRVQHTARLADLQHKLQQRNLVASGDKGGSAQWRVAHEQLWQGVVTVLEQRIVPVLQDPHRLRMAINSNQLEAVVGTLQQMYTQPMHHVQLSPTLNDEQLLKAEMPVIASLLQSAMVLRTHEHALGAVTEACVRLQKLAEQIEANAHTLKLMSDAEYSRAVEHATQRFNNQVRETYDAATKQLAQLTSDNVKASKAQVEEWTNAWTRLRQSHAVVAARIMSDLQDWYIAAVEQHNAQQVYDEQQQQLEFVTAIIEFRTT